MLTFMSLSEADFIPTIIISSMTAAAYLCLPYSPIFPHFLLFATLIILPLKTSMTKNNQLNKWGENGAEREVRSSSPLPTDRQLNQPHVPPQYKSSVHLKQCFLHKNITETFMTAF